MKRWALIAMSLCMTLVFTESGLMAKGGRGQGAGAGRGHGNRSVFDQNSDGNGQGFTDRELGTDRAREVGRGKKKGLYKDQYSIGDGHDKDRSSHKKDKDKVKKQHKDKD